jgi:hypothetical protein
MTFRLEIGPAGAAILRHRSGAFRQCHWGYCFSLNAVFAVSIMKFRIGATHGIPAFSGDLK